MDTSNVDNWWVSPFEEKFAEHAEVNNCSIVRMEHLPSGSAHFFSDIISDCLDKRYFISMKAHLLRRYFFDYKISRNIRKSHLLSVAIWCYWLGFYHLKFLEQSQCDHPICCAQRAYELQVALDEWFEKETPRIAFYLDSEEHTSEDFGTYIIDDWNRMFKRCHVCQFCESHVDDVLAASTAIAVADQKGEHWGGTTLLRNATQFRRAYNGPPPFDEAYKWVAFCRKQSFKPILYVWKDRNNDYYDRKRKWTPLCCPFFQREVRQREACLEEQEVESCAKEEAI